MNKILLTGRIGVGKSTIIKSLLKSTNLKVGGYTEEKILNKNSEIIKIKSLASKGKEGIIAVRNINTMSVTAYTDVFNTIGTQILDESLKISELIVMDEIGFLEEKAQLFKNKIIEILDSNKYVIGVIKDFDKKGELLDMIRERKDITIISVDENNRDALPNKIFHDLKLQSTF